jgi:hypothetical protein
MSDNWWHGFFTGGIFIVACIAVYALYLHVTGG